MSDEEHAALPDGTQIGDGRAEVCAILREELVYTTETAFHLSYRLSLSSNRLHRVERFGPEVGEPGRRKLKRLASKLMAQWLAEGREKKA